jgi:endoglucanase
MVDAHTDEVGLIITRIEKSGLLGFRTVGGIDARLLPAKRVIVGRKRLRGVVLTPPVHLVEKDQRQRITKIDKLGIDIGTTSLEEASALIGMGDYVVFDTRFQVLSEGSLRAVKAKALDDRAGCAAAAALADGDYAVDLYLSFSSQEESGLRGARTAAFQIAPDMAFVLEGTVCDDAPKRKDTSPTTELGKGPAITVMDRSFIADERLVRALTDVAEANGLPHQFKQPGVGGTDAGAIHLTRTGVPSVAVSVPCRYIHGPVGLMSLNDFDHLVALMRATLHALPERWE